MSIDFSDIMKNKGAYLSEKEIDDMLTYCDETADLTSGSEKHKWFRNYMLIYILERTGRRITEIVGEPPHNKKKGFRPCDIDYQDGTIEWGILKKNHIKTTNKAGLKRSKEVLIRERLAKNPKSIKIAVDDDFLSFLKDYIEFMEIPEYKRVIPITRSMADKIIKKVAKACKIKRKDTKIHCHMFRHSFAINLLKKNPNDASTLRVVQELLAHSDLKMTMTYTQFTQEDKRAILNRTFANR